MGRGEEKKRDLAIPVYCSTIQQPLYWYTTKAQCKQATKSYQMYAYFRTQKIHTDNNYLCTIGTYNLHSDCSIKETLAVIQFKVLKDSLKQHSKPH